MHDFQADTSAILEEVTVDCGTSGPGFELVNLPESMEFVSSSVGDLHCRKSWLKYVVGEDDFSRYQGRIDYVYIYYCTCIGERKHSANPSIPFQSKRSNQEKGRSEEKSKTGYMFI